MEAATLNVLLVVFLATLVRSTFGFGEALIAVPLLALSIPIAVATPLAVLLSITTAAIVVVQDWRKIHIRSTVWLLAPTFLGIPLGIVLLTSAHQNFVKAALVIVIMAFSGYFLAGKEQPELRSDSRSWLLGCGFVAGVLGGDPVHASAIGPGRRLEGTSRWTGCWRSEDVFLCGGQERLPTGPRHRRKDNEASDSKSGTA